MRVRGARQLLRSRPAQCADRGSTVVLPLPLDVFRNLRGGHGAAEA